MQVEMEAMAIEMPPVARHPNRMPFEGVLTIANEASDKPPSGARGHRVLLPAASVEAALPSLLGMAVDYAPSLDRHDARRKVGIITSAELEPHGDSIRKLAVEGYLFAQDFPEVVREMSAGEGSLGMSYEIADAVVVDVNAPVWVVNEFTFTGAAVLRRDKAAYRKTSIRLV
ncbi:MAG: hypothetical protein ROO76_10950 [Terriglobia bacterium]|nr:hypothetical protein [Terriglobia bacterium]